MKQASTQALTEYILYDIVNGSSAQPTAKVEYKNDAGSWIEFADVEAVSVSNTNVNREYGRFKLIPGSNTASLSLDNFDSKYSPNTGNDFDGVLIRNREIRPSLGYVLPVTSESTYTYAGTGLTKWYTNESAGTITSQDTTTDSFDALPGITESWDIYGTGLYGTATYTPEAYFLSEVITFDRFDELQSLNVTADNVNLEVWYRSSLNKAQLDDNIISFTSLGNTIVGSQEYDLLSLTDRYFQFCIVWSTGHYGAGSVTAVSIDYIGKYERFDQGVFYLDDPTFSVSYGNYKCSAGARDLFKKSYETNVTCPSYTSSTDVAEIMRDVCDRCGIAHNDGTELIANTGYIITIADDDNFKNVKAIDILDECMFYLNAKDTNYRLERYDEYARLVIKDDDLTEADWQLDYRFNLFTLSKRYVSNKLLQRITVLNEDEVVDPEIQLTTNGYTVDATGQDLSWSNDAMYIRIETSGTGTLTLNYVDLANNLINIDVSGISGTFTVNVFGCELSNARSAYFGSSVYYDNSQTFDGITHKITNRLIQSDAEAKDIAEGVMALYGNPSFEITATINCNPLLELGDKLIIWEKTSNTNSLFRVDNISIPFSANGASLKQTIKLTDLGIPAITNYIWDRNGVTTGSSDFNYDKGLLLDQDLGPQVTSDPATYTARARY